MALENFNFEHINLLAYAGPCGNLRGGKKTSEGHKNKIELKRDT